MSSRLLVLLLLITACEDKPKPAPGPAPTVTTKDACDRPLPMTVGISNSGDLTGGARCYAFDGVSNATLVLENEVKSGGAYELTVFDPEAKGEPVCHASIDDASAPWGKPKSMECAGFRKTALHLVRVEGKGSYRFTLRPR